MGDVSAYLTEMADKAKDPELGELLSQLQQLHQKRLWHQLTQTLLKIVEHEELQANQQLYNFYTNVIADFEIKLNPLKLVQICTPIVAKFEKKEEAVQFLEKLGDKVKSDTEAFVLTKVLYGEIQLNHYGNLEKVKETIEEIETLLEDVEGVGEVHGKYYLMAAELYKKDMNYAEYYRASLRFLGCTSLDTLADDQKVSQAVHLCLAALLGQDVFNFGELLAHPILDSLKGTPNGWIVDLLFAFNSGNVCRYRAMQDQWGSQPDLRASEIVLYEKICLLALMEMTFRRSANDRSITFKDIAKQTNLPEDKVELLVMKALAKGLVKGSIDQVDQTVSLTWVQPRVLDQGQVQNLMEKISGLTSSIQNMESMIQENANEILTV